MIARHTKCTGRKRETRERVIQTHMHTYRQAGGQAGRQAGGQAGRQADRKTDRHTQGGGQSPSTSTKLVASVVVPMPSCPFQFRPQHLTPPPLTIAHVWYPPRAMATAEMPARRRI